MNWLDVNMPSVITEVNEVSESIGPLRFQIRSKKRLRLSIHLMKQVLLRLNFLICLGR